MSSPSNRAHDRAVSPTVHRNLLIAVVALVPALAYGNAPAGESFTAVDYAWRANGTDATRLTIAPNTTVTFSYPDGADYHNVVFKDRQPSSCEGLPPGPRPKGWQGECTFADPGTYAFVCGAHEEMTGSVVVAAPTPTPTPTPTPSPTPTPDPGG